MTRCEALNADGHQRCRRRSFRHPFCAQHLRSLLGLVVRPSAVPSHGCGLYTTRPIKKDDVVVVYSGRLYPNLAAIEVERGLVVGRSDNRFPYAMGVNNATVDATCLRGVGSYANHRPRSSANLRTEIYTSQPAHDRYYTPDDDGRAWLFKTIARRPPSC